MARRVLLLTVITCSLAVLSCTSYQSSGATGGFSETQLNATTYQVRFRGNGYTSKARTAQFLLRRAAELTLEKGYRYFLLSEMEDISRDDAWAQYPMQSSTVRMLENATEHPEAADAVIVIRETDELAGRRLSPAARSAIARFGG